MSYWLAAVAECSWKNRCYYRKNCCDTMGSVPILSQQFSQSQSQSLTVNDTLDVSAV